MVLVSVWLGAPAVLRAGANAVSDPNSSPDVTATGGAMSAIALTSIPPYGVSDLLRGSATGVAPAAAAVAVYIFVPPTGWWSKPTIAAPRTTIKPDGTWECNIATSPTDVYATRIMAFLIPATYDPPLMDGQQCLPRGLSAYPYVHAYRYERIVFANCDWLVKREHDVIDPGPNFFSDDMANVSLDANRRLHLKIAQRGGVWYCSEVIADRPLGYGRYAFTVAGGIPELNPNAVLGLFTWEDCVIGYFYRELDIEFSRWGDAASPNTQYVVQPFQHTGNVERFETNPASDPNGMTTHEFIWEPNDVSFRSYYGGFALHPADSSIIKAWHYTGKDVQPAGNGNIRMNLWLNNGTPPTDGKDVEVSLSNVTYLPGEPNCVYRFWSPVSSHHFYTISQSEKVKLEEQYANFWTYEGVAYWTPATGGRASLVPIFRFWSESLNGHFYTADEVERDKLINQYSAVWTYEGPAFYAWRDGQQPPGTAAVHRFWSETLGSHFYTMDEAEKQKLIDVYSAVWTYEGIAWHAYPLPAPTE